MRQDVNRAKIAKGQLSLVLRKILIVPRRRQCNKRLGSPINQSIFLSMGIRIFCSDLAAIRCVGWSDGSTSESGRCNASGQTSRSQSKKSLIDLAAGLRLPHSPDIEKCTVLSQSAQAFEDSKTCSDGKAEQGKHLASFPSPLVRNWLFVHYIRPDRGEEAKHRYDET